MCKFKSTQLVLIRIVASVLALTPFFVQAQLDDPTRPPGYRLVLPGGKNAESAVIKFTLSSVFISPVKRAAVVNDRTVEVGEYVDGAKVVSIGSSTVKLQKQGKIFTVRLLSQAVKKTRSQ